MDLKKIIKFLEYLGQFPDEYVIIGGTACEINLANTGINSRPTKDYDIVLCVENIECDFCNGLAKLIKDGNYKEGFSNQKKTAYRFVKPKDEYPKQIELFASEEFGSLSIDKHLSKLNIVVDENQISSIVIDKEIYEFIKNRKQIIDGVSTVDRYGLLLLKVVAYFKNLELYYSKDEMKKSNEFKKHNEDVVLILASFLDSDVVPLINYPDKYKKELKDFIDVLSSSQQILINKGLNNTKIQILVDRYKKIFNI